MKSYLKFLSRNKLYTAIQAVGLIVSLAFVILIGSYVRQQWQVARGAPEWKHYYLVSNNLNNVDVSASGLAFFLKENLPGVDYAAYYSNGLAAIKVADHPSQNVAGAAVNQDFLRMFPIEWVAGDPASLADGVAISAKMALDYFPGQEAIGQTIYAEDLEKSLPVVAVFKSLGSPIFNASDLLMQREFKTLSQGATGGTVCIISTRTPEDELIRSLDQLFETHLRMNWNRDETRAFVNGSIERMDRLYFSDLNGEYAFHHGNLSMLRMLLAVVLLLLVSAVLNYINLSAAVAGRRAKEMGIRSILGSSRGQILRRYLTESLAFTAACAVLSLLLAYALTPLIHNYVDVMRGKRIISAPFTWQWDAASVGLFVVGVIVIGLLAGWIPARISSRFHPAQIVKGDFRLRSKRVFSKVFIVFQTALAVMMIAFSLVMERQFSHMVHRPLGAKVDNVYVQWRVSDAQKDALEKLPFVKGIGCSDGYPGSRYMTMGMPSKDGNGTYYFSVINLDPSSFRICGFEVMEDYHTPSGTGIWLTESTYRRLSENYDMTTLPQDISVFQKKEFAGILRDVATSDAAHVDPSHMGVISVQDPLKRANFFLMEIEGDRKAAVAELEELYRQFSMERYGEERYTASNGFILDEMREGLAEAEKYMRLIELFMILGVLVSLLGLLAMSSFYASEQTHDVAVRKVFGGTVGGEVIHGVGSYMLLVAIACVVAIPAAVWLSGRYLQDFVYRISGYGWIFAVAVVIALLISFASVLWQTLRAARTNPAVELKKE